MDPGELNSKSPRGNVFDPGTLGHGLFGATVSNSALLYTHYAHLPNSLPLLSHPTAFPVQPNLASSAFGGLGALATPVTSATYTSSPPGAAWWPMASRLLYPDYLMRSLVSSTTNSTFVNLNRDSLLPGYDVLSQQSPHHPPPHKINFDCKSSTSSRRKAVSTVSSERRVNSPIYTTPNVGVTLTYDKNISDLSFHSNGANMPPSSVTPVSSESKTRQSTPDKHSVPTPGVHSLPITVITKESNSTAWKRCHSSPKSSQLESAHNEKYQSDLDSKSSEKLPDGESKDLSSNNEKLEASLHAHKIDSLINKKEENDNSEASKNEFAVVVSASSSLESATGPLNLSLKSHSVSPPLPLLKQEMPPSRKKKSKHNSIGLAKLDIMDHTYNQEEISPHLDAQTKQLKTNKRAAKQSLSRGNKLDLKQMSTSSLLSSFATSTPLSSRAISLLTGAPAQISSADLTLSQTTTPSQSISVMSNDNLGFSMSKLGDLANRNDDYNRNVSKLNITDSSSDDESSADDSSDDSDSSSKSNSSSSETESESDTADTEDTEKSHTTSAASTPVSGLLKGQKRYHENSGIASPSIKRRRLMVEETELRIPLEHGWRRQTKIRTFICSGVRGTVTYFTPCGKKLKTYPEVVRYLDKNNITDITRENFSFSSKVNIGEFLEPIENGDNIEYIPLGEQEVLARISERRATRRRRSAIRSERNKTSDEKLKNDTKHHSRLDLQSDGVFNLSESKLQKKFEREKVALANKEAKKLKAIEAKQRKEHLKLLRQKEKFERQEQIRIEKEMRAQQMFEARKKRQEQLEKQRVEEAMRKAKERELKRQQAVFFKVQELQKRREMLIMVDLERERRRQHMLLVKALEAHKKQEERERIREERKTEKRLNKERKMEQRKLELEALRELRKPVEDLEIAEADPLPTFDRIPGVKLPGKAFSDLLMVVEFLHNFGETLGFDMQNLPTLNTLQMALLNNENAEEELISVMHHLLTCAIEDPGPPINTKHLSVLGQSLKEVDITGYTISEVLRIFIQAFAGESNAMGQWLKERPYLSLNPTQKASILAFICNELLCSRAICRQIDASIDLVASLRKDKWMIEGKLRKLKSIQNKKLRLSQKSEVTDNDKEKDEKNVQAATGDTSAKADEDDGANESGNESEGSQLTGHGEMEAEEQEEEEIGMSVDELKKQIDKLSKQMNQYRGKLIKTSHQLRTMSFGQDRYKRRYWVLPYVGGVLIEGMESSELAGETQQDNNEEKMEIDECNESEIVTVNGVKEEAKCEKNTIEQKACKEEQKNCDNEEYENRKIDEEDEKMDVDDTQIDSFSEKRENSTKLFNNNSSLNTNSKLEASFKSEKNERCFYKSLGHEFSVHPQTDSNHTSYESSPFCLSMENILKPSPEKSLGKPWFSLLPRMPCDETSLTRIHVSSSSKNTNHVKFPLPLPYNSFGLYPNSSPFSALPLGIMNGNINMDSSTKLVPSPLSNYSSTPVPHRLSNCTSPAPIDIDFSMDDKLKTYPEAKPVPLEFQRGWWRISNVDQLKELMKALHSRGIRERMLYKQLEKYEEFACEACSKAKENVLDLEITNLDDKIANCVGAAPEPDDTESWSVEIARRVDLSVLEHVETLEERLINSSMQVKNWKPDAKASIDSGVKYRAACEVDDSAVSLVDVARHRLHELELHIEPRYIKPPLGHNATDLSNINHSNSNGNTSANGNSSVEGSCSPSDDPPPRLIHWRNAVETVKTSAQLAMCLSLLENCIAWDKSIMKASCQFCNSGDNEAMLLLCDGCDKGYHMYCFKPKMDSIPDGDWYCNECLNKATGDRVCLVCSKKGKNLIVCNGCPKAFHTDCLDPPLSRMPKGKWMCSQCNQKPVKTKSKNTTAAANSGTTSVRRKELANKSKDDVSEEQHSKADKSQRQSDKNRSGDKSKDKQRLSRELAPCRTILGEMELHEDAWPFLLPVNTKQFPSYRKVIKKVMDLSTMKQKLTDGSYKTKEEFCNDARLIFDNCETFNEDDSPVGKAGHNMRAFFESRWAELKGN